MSATSVQEAQQTVEWHETAWQTTVKRISAIAHAKLGEEYHGHLERATALVLGGKVWIEEDGKTAWVYSQRQDAWYHPNGTCGCPDQAFHPARICKHRLSRGLYLRAQELLAQPALQAVETVLPPLAAAAARVEAPTIPAQYLVMIQGKPFVKYEGLLALAQAQGLVELAATWTYNDPELSLAHAVAIFEDGRRFEESGDATPTNVGTKVAAHFRRMALTRAKARALRDALNLSYVALEELGEED